MEILHIISILSTSRNFTRISPRAANILNQLIHVGSLCFSLLRLRFFFQPPTAAALRGFILHYYLCCRLIPEEISHRLRALHWEKNSHCLQIFRFFFWPMALSSAHSLKYRLLIFILPPPVGFDFVEELRCYHPLTPRKPCTAHFSMLLTFVSKPCGHALCSSPRP